MTTYFRDFAKSALEKAWEYAAGRSSLGHNVRFLRMEKGTSVFYRVYFSSGLCNPKTAIDMKDVPVEDKR